MIICCLTAVLSAGVSLLIKEKYKSTVIMFATQQHSFGEQLLEDVKKEDVLAYGEEEDAERLLQLINSDQIRNQVIEKYDLWKWYDIPRDSKGANTLIAKEYNDNISARLTKFGSIEVSVLDENPEQAMKIANDIGSYADTVSNKMRSERALMAFHYSETSLNNLQAELRSMEDSMKVLQEMGVYSYEDQIAALTEQFGKAIIDGHPDRAQKIKEQMDFLSKYGTLFKKLESSITAGYEKMEVLKRRYDLMKIDVESNLPSKFLMDSATAADKKSYPIRWLIVAMSTASAFVFTVIFLLVWENIKRLREEGRL